VRWVVALTVFACQQARVPSPPAPDKAVILSARDRDDQNTLRAHGWKLWQRIQDSWESWPRSDVVLGETDRIFRELQPFEVHGRVERETAPLMFQVIFDPIAAAHVDRYHLARKTTFRSHAAIPDFPDAAILLKAVWYPVHREGVTKLPVWDGEQPIADGNPTRTWSRSVVIDPRVEEPTSGFDDDDHHVPLDAFIHRELTTWDEVDAARRVARDPTLAIGDHVVLVGMHISTREIPDWVWVTLWWHDRPEDGPYAAVRPALAGAARSYLLDAASSVQHVAMNPYLEARFPDGLHSNCLACHRRAALGTDQYLPVVRGDTPATDPYFADKTTTDLVWTLALEAR